VAPTYDASQVLNSGLGKAEVAGRSELCIAVCCLRHRDYIYRGMYSLWLLIIVLQEHTFPALNISRTALAPKAAIIYICGVRSSKTTHTIPEPSRNKKNWLTATTLSQLVEIPSSLSHAGKGKEY
jgi:hypothetical protein